MGLSQILVAIAPPQAAPSAGIMSSDPKSREIRRTAAIALGGNRTALLKLYALDVLLALDVEESLRSRRADRLSAASVE